MAEPGTEDYKDIVKSDVIPQATDVDMSEDICKDVGPGNYISAAFRNGYESIAFHTEDEATKAMGGDEHQWVGLSHRVVSINLYSPTPI